MTEIKSNFLDKDAILDSVTKEDVVKICESLGCKTWREDNSGALIFNTQICHGGNSEKLYIYLNKDEETGKKYWSCHCYTCNDTYGLIELVIRANRLNGKTVTWYRALLYIANITNNILYRDGEDTRNDVVTSDDFKWINHIKSAQKKKRSVPNLKPINENILEIFCYLPHEEWLSDNITREAMSRYEISYYGLNNSIIIPHRDRHDNLIGIRQRFLDKSDIDLYNGKYMPLHINGDFLSHSLANNLYGINVVQDKIKRCKKCLLVESEKSCMQTYSYFGKDSFALAVCGSNISKNQIKLLQDMGVEEVIVGFDKEYEDHQSFLAESYYNKLVLKVAPMVQHFRVSLLLDTENLLNKKDSPTDKGKEVLLHLMENKFVITTDEVNRIMSKNRKEENGRTI